MHNTNNVLGSLLEVTLKTKDDFLKIKETLSRIGIPAKPVENGSGKKRLIQSCHILHKKGKYYIVHFKEMFLLDGKTANITSKDIERRNIIANLLEQWGLLEIVDTKYVIDDDDLKNNRSLKSLKIISHSQKKDWELVSKYRIGKKLYTQNNNFSS